MRPTPTTVRAAADLLGRHPRWVDAGLVVLLVVLDGPAALPGLGVTGWLWFLAIHMPLVWRRRAPVPVFWAVFVLVVSWAVLAGVRTEGIFPEIVVAVAVYTVARHRGWRHLWPVVAVIEIPTVAFLLSAARNWTALGFVTFGLAATVLLGVTLRIRQTYLAELSRQRERERHQQTRLAVAAERGRIARDLHDIVAHNLAVMVALADGAAYTAGATPERAAEAMEKVATTGRQALGEMRRLLGLLREDAVGRAPQPGLDDLDGLLAQVRAAGPRVRLSIDGVPHDRGPGADLTVYRIVQEALTNTLKHAGPGAQVEVRLHHHDDGVDLEVVDDGAGRPAVPTSDGGHGLAGMIERAAAYGGRVEAGPRTDGPGWRMVARLRFDEGGSV
ncbi:sensor histidine kinase [Plantactinospora sonchi]|uniref:histidine kinase n=1 Tax=Plantactinospora sonchi TaxID=1544735 RepID=A0ABU7RL51_9ACTN